MTKTSTMSIDQAANDAGELSPELARRLGQMLGQALSGLGDASDEAPALTIEPALEPTAPALLARSHGSPKARAQAQAMYLKCLTHYRTKVQRGLPTDDLGAAAAYFVLANLAALQNLNVSEAQLALVERQMRRLMGRHAAWQAADARHRQTLFEQFAVLGVLVGESQAQARTQGAAALRNVQQAARGYLRELLGIDPDVLRLDEHGLRLEIQVPAAAGH
jgi:hypothetical protein